MSSAITGRHSNAPTTIDRGIETVFIIGFIIYAGLCTCRHDSSTTPAKVLKNNGACQPYRENIPSPPLRAEPDTRQHIISRATSIWKVPTATNIRTTTPWEALHRNTNIRASSIWKAFHRIKPESTPPHKTKTGTTLVQDDSHYSYPIRGYSYPIRGLRFAKTILLPEPPSP